MFLVIYKLKIIINNNSSDFIFSSFPAANSEILRTKTATITQNCVADISSVTGTVKAFDWFEKWHRASVKKIGIHTKSSASILNSIVK